MKIYSGKGDFGETLNLNGQLLSKNDSIVHFFGDLDELNCHLGLVKVLVTNEETKNFIELLQKNLMKIMANVSYAPALNEKYQLVDTDITLLEKEIDKLSANIRIHEFVIPGKNITEAQIQIARTVARRAERHFVALNETQNLNQNQSILPLCLKTGVYLNRLSDYLFILSQAVFFKHTFLFKEALDKL